MRMTLTMIGRPVELELSPSAEKQLEIINNQLYVEMELYFSCLLRKRVVVRTTDQSDYTVSISDKLKIGFRPVMTKSCSISDCNGESPPLSDFPIVRPESYVPHWLKIDFRKGEWMGEFGYLDEPFRRKAV